MKDEIINKTLYTKQFENNKFELKDSKLNVVLFTNEI